MSPRSRNASRIAAIVLVAAALLAGGIAAPARAADGYTTPAPFMTLFKLFPISQGPDTIGRQLSGWDPAQTPVPGLTTGFPPGIDSYPAGNPDF